MGFAALNPSYKAMGAESSECDLGEALINTVEPSGDAVDAFRQSMEIGAVGGHFRPEIA